VTAGRLGSAESWRSVARRTTASRHPALPDLWTAGKACEQVGVGAAAVDLNVAVGGDVGGGTRGPEHDGELR
jgi:hypothetical protein